MGNPARVRMVFVVVAGLVLWWGSSLVADAWQPDSDPASDRDLAERSLATAIAEVEEASNLFDHKVRSSDVGEDLSKGWEDLRRDTMSVLREMARRPHSQMILDFANRVEAFWMTYSPRDGIGPATAEWQGFEDAFANAVGMRESIVSSAPAVNES